MISQHLDSDCQGYCKTCSAPVKEREGGGWYITINHPGFNSPTNNRFGYKTKEAAIRAYNKYRGVK